MSTTPQGQGHATVAAQVAADVLGVTPQDIHVRDRGRHRLQPVDGLVRHVFVAASRASAPAPSARRRAARGASCASSPPRSSLRARGRRARGRPGRGRARPDASVSLRRLVGAAHWNPDGLPDGVEPGLHAVAFCARRSFRRPTARTTSSRRARTGSSSTSRWSRSSAQTGSVTVLDYVSVHDAGRLLNPRLAAGQVQGGFAHGVGAALQERASLRRGRRAADADAHGVPARHAATDLPPPRTGHRETPSPLTPLGAKGLGEGTTMSAPAALAQRGHRRARAPTTGRAAAEPVARVGAHPVKPAPFRYAGPERSTEALAVARRARPRSVRARRRPEPRAADEPAPRAAPAVLVDINRVPGLGRDRRRRRARCGSARSCAQRAFERHPAARPLPPRWPPRLPFVGHVATRNRGTVGGSIAHADAARRAAARACSRSAARPSSRARAGAARSRPRTCSPTHLTNVARARRGARRGRLAADGPGTGVGLRGGRAAPRRLRASRSAACTLRVEDGVVRAASRRRRRGRPTGRSTVPDAAALLVGGALDDDARRGRGRGARVRRCSPPTASTAGRLPPPPGRRARPSGPRARRGPTRRRGWPRDGSP